MVEEMGAKKSSTAQKSSSQAAATAAAGSGGAAPVSEMRTNVEDIVKTNAPTAWMDAVEQQSE